MRIRRKKKEREKKNSIHDLHCRFDGQYAKQGDYGEKINHCTIARRCVGVGKEGLVEEGVGGSGYTHAVWCRGIRCRGEGEENCGRVLLAKGCKGKLGNEVMSTEYTMGIGSVCGGGVKSRVEGVGNCREVVLVKECRCKEGRG